MVVEVDHEKRIRCQAPGYGRPVSKRIHVVQDDEKLIVMGSSCCADAAGFFGNVL